MPNRLHIVAIAVLSLGAFLASLALLPQLPLRAGELPEKYFMPAYADPGDDAFFIYAQASELSHLVLYHDIGASIDNARQADILFFGNSRMQLGLREQVKHNSGLQYSRDFWRRFIALEPVQRRLLRAPQDAESLSGAETENPAGDRTKG